MKLAVMQPYFFPYIGYFQLMRAVDVFVPYDGFTFQKRGWAHRNRILLPGSILSRIGVCLCAKSSFKRVADLQLDDSTPWRRRLLKTIRCSYSHRPFFDETYPVLEELILAGVSALSEFNKRCVQRIAQHLGIHTSLPPAVRLDDLAASLDSRCEPLEKAHSQTQLDTPDRRTIRVIAICRALGGTVLVNARGGMELYRKRDFAQNGISLFFLVTRPLSYSQGTPQFYPDLSIIDVLMNCGRDRTREFLDLYDLV
jgi:hypothetical protein